MATKRALAAPVDGEYVEIEGTSEDISELEDSLEQELREAYSGLNADPNDQTIYYKVLKQVKGYKKAYDCFQFNHCELDGIADRIRDEFGSGFYIVNMIKNGRLHKKFDYPVLAPAKKATDQPGDLSTIMRAMADQQRVMFEQLRETMLHASHGGALPSNPITLMRDMAEVMKSIMPSQPAASGNSLRDMVETMTLLKELMPSGGESNWVDLVGKFLDSPVTGAVLQGLASKQITATPAAPRVINPESGGVSTNVPNNLTEQQQMELKTISEKINWLCDRAAVNGSHDAAAVMLEEDLGTVFFRSLTDPAAISRAALLVPRVNQYLPWFNEFQQTVIQMIKEDDEGTK